MLEWWIAGPYSRQGEIWERSARCVCELVKALCQTIDHLHLGLDRVDPLNEFLMFCPALRVAKPRVSEARGHS